MDPRAPPRWLDSTGASIAAVVGSCVALRSAAFRYGVVSDDEGIYAAMARDVVAGGVMYKDTVDHKPPGIVMTYAGAFWAAGGDYARGMTLVHALGMLWVVGTSLAIWAIGRRVLDRRAAVVAALLYAVFSAAKVPYDGLAVNGELLMNLPTALAALAAVEASSRSGWRRVAFDLAAGVLAGCAILYKYQAGLVLAAMLVLALEGGVPRFFGRAMTWALGAVAPFVGCFLYFRAHGALEDALFWGIEFNRHYLAEGPPLAWAAKRLAAQVAGVVLPAIVLYAAGVLTTWRIVLLGRRDARVEQDVLRHRAFLAAWVVLSLAALGLGGRVFGHYFLQAELPLALAAAGPVTRWLARAPRLLAAGVVAPALFFACGCWLPLAHPGSWLDSAQPDYDGIGQAIARATGPKDTIWVWGNVPQLYFTSGRRPGVRFTFCNYLTGLSPATPSEYDPSVDPGKNAVPGAMALALEDLRRRRPAVVVDTAAAGLKSYGRFPIARYPSLAAYLSAHYRQDADAEGVPLYRRVD
jgi:4-amino-4-deoxy-L-arabinose transferase-like glycosyltransferase